MPGDPGIRMLTSKITASSLPSSAMIAPCRAKGPMIPGLHSSLLVFTNFSPISKIFSSRDSLVVQVTCPVSIIFGSL